MSENERAAYVRGWQDAYAMVKGILNTTELELELTREVPGRFGVIDGRGTKRKNAGASMSNESA